jgi:hypothetical protein
MAKYTDVFVTNIQEINETFSVVVDPETKKKAYNLILKMYPDSKDHQELLEMLDLMELEEAV